MNCKGTSLNKTIKLLEIIGQNLWELELGKEFLHLTERRFIKGKNQ